MSLESVRLRSFRLVAEELNFTRAAERLFLTQPAVTLQIKALEELGVRLFARRQNYQPPAAPLPRYIYNVVAADFSVAAGTPLVKSRNSPPRPSKHAPGEIFLLGESSLFSTSLRPNPTLVSRSHPHSQRSSRTSPGQRLRTHWCGLRTSLDF